MSNFSQRYARKPKLQAEHPAFIRAAAREKAIGIHPKYMNAGSRRRATMSGLEWELAAREWDRANATMA